MRHSGICTARAFGRMVPPLARRMGIVVNPAVPRNPVEKPSAETEQRRSEILEVAHLVPDAEHRDGVGPVGNNEEIVAGKIGREPGPECHDADLETLAIRRGCDFL